jgi:hypothetical protein
MKPITFASPTICLVLVLVSFAQDDRNASSRSIAGFETGSGLVNWAEGNVRVKSAQVNPRRILIRNQVGDGDVVVTSAGSRAEILLSPSYYLRLGENTTCVMAHLSPDNQKLRIVTGTAIVEILENNSNTFGEDAYELLTMCTPQGECCTTGGGIFLFEVRDTESFVQALRGEAIVEDKKLREGFEATMRRGPEVMIRPIETSLNEEFNKWSAARSALLASANKEVKNEDWYRERSRGAVLTIDTEEEEFDDLFTTSAATGAVSFVEDGVQCSREGGAWSALSNHVSLRDGDRIRTGDASRAQISLSPGVLLALSGQSELVYSQTGPNKIRVSLIHGSAILSASTGEALEDVGVVLSTAAGDLAIKQAGNYRANVDRDETEVLVRRGRVAFGANEIKSGYEALFSRGKLNVVKLGKQVRDTFDVWSERRERGTSSRQTWLDTKRARLNRARTGVWYYCRTAKTFTFVPGLWDFKSPYGGSYPVKLRFGGRSRPRGPSPWGVRFPK